jgi:AcrR family transcriptional regulator
MARTRAQDYAEKRSAILEHSAELFARFGFSGASITMIAEACGVSKALLYHYYPDKEALLFDIINAHLQELLDAVRTAAEAAREPREGVRAIAHALLEAYRNADHQHQVQIANLKLLPENRRKALVAMERELVALLSDALSAALPDIGHGPLLKPLTMSMFGMLNWHYLWFREGKELSRSDYADLVTTLILSGSPAVAEKFPFGAGQ